jgi:hypothetical protein
MSTERRPLDADDVEAILESAHASKAGRMGVNDLATAAIDVCRAWRVEHARAEEYRLALLVAAEAARGLIGADERSEMQIRAIGDACAKALGGEAVEATTDRERVRVLREMVSDRERLGGALADAAAAVLGAGSLVGSVPTEADWRALEAAEVAWRAEVDQTAGGDTAAAVAPTLPPAPLGGADTLPPVAGELGGLAEAVGAALSADESLVPEADELGTPDEADLLRKVASTDAFDAAWLASAPKGQRAPHPDPERGEAYERLEGDLAGARLPKPRAGWEGRVLAAVEATGAELKAKDEEARKQRRLEEALANPPPREPPEGWDAPVWSAIDASERKEKGNG